MWKSIENAVQTWSEHHHFKMKSPRRECLEVHMVDDKRDDVLTIARRKDKVCIDYINGASGATEVLDCTIDSLPRVLDEILAKSDGWASFMSFGPGRGH